MPTTDRLVIYGNGHMAKMLYHFLKKAYLVVGFTVDKACIDSNEIESLPVIPFDLVENHFSPDEHALLVAVGFSRMNALRQLKCEESISKGYQLINYVHPSVECHDDMIQGVNNIILDHASIHPGTVLGNGNFISSNTNIGHGCTLGDYNWFNAGVGVGGETHCGNRSFFGINCVIGHGIAIGDENFIGANALVSKSTPDKGVYLTESSERFRLDSDRFLTFASGIE